MVTGMVMVTVLMHNQNSVTMWIRAHAGFVRLLCCFTVFFLFLLVFCILFFSFMLVKSIDIRLL